MNAFALALCRAAAVATLGCAALGTADAQTTPTALPQVVITAARSSQSLEDALPATTVITRKEIERWQYGDLVDALRRQTGVEFSRTGGPGGATSLFLRGANSSQVLVLVDGVRLNASVGGAASLGGIAVDSIDRIEIVRGNLSSLYGSAAVGGVVQIFTSAGRATGWSVSAEVGQGNLWSGAASGAAAVDDLRVGGTLAARSSKQFSAIDAARIVPGPFAAGANPERDGNRNTNGSFGVSYRPREGTSLALNAWASHNRTDFDSTFDGPTATHFERSRLSSLSATARHALTDSWQTQLQLGSVRDRSRNRVSDPFSFNNAEFESDNRQITWTSEVAVAQSVNAQFGVELLRQQGASTAFDPNFGNTLTGFERDVKSGWFGVNGSGGAQQVQINFRHDDYSDVGSATSGLLSYGYRLTPGLRTVVQVANAFRAPSFSDLYFPFFGNSALKPEKSRSAELGLQYTADAVSLRATAYQTSTRRLIVYDPASMRAENIDRARMTGVELVAETQLGRWQLAANASIVRPIDVATGERLLRRAPYTVNASIAYDATDWRAGLELAHAGKRADLDINTFQRVDLDPYTVVRIVAALRLAPHLMLNLRVENLADERYETVSGYNVQPRTAVVGVTLSH